MLDHETWGLGWTPICYSVDPGSAWPIFWWFYMERRALELRSVSVPYFSSLLCHATFECKNWYILHLWMFGLSFSRFCGNTLACPVCVGFFQANMPTETNHSSEIAASEYRANSLPADENTPLVREANSTSHQHRLCEHFNYRHFLLGFFLNVFVRWGGFSRDKYYLFS